MADSADPTAGTVSLRLAQPADGAACSKVYAPYVESTAISFELQAPGPEEMAGRIEVTLTGYPWLVATDQGTIIGYAYAHQFASRPAYGWSVETSVYLRGDAQRKGTGRALYSALLDIVRSQGFVAAFAGIALPNDPSVRLHESLNFRPAGVFHRVGWKLGAWHDVGWWRCELHPAARSVEPTPPLSLVALGADKIEAILAAASPPGLFPPDLQRAAEPDQPSAVASSTVSSAAGSASRRSSGIGAPLRTERP